MAELNYLTDDIKYIKCKSKYMSVSDVAKSLTQKTRFTRRFSADDVLVIMKRYKIHKPSYSEIKENIKQYNIEHSEKRDLIRSCDALAKKKKKPLIKYRHVVGPTVKAHNCKLQTFELVEGECYDIIVKTSTGTSHTTTKWNPKRYNFKYMYCDEDNIYFRSPAGYVESFPKHNKLLNITHIINNQGKDDMINE